MSDTVQRFTRTEKERKTHKNTIGIRDTTGLWDYIYTQNGDLYAVEGKQE